MDWSSPADSHSGPSPGAVLRRWFAGHFSVASGGYDNTVRLWDLKELKPIATNQC